MGEYTNGDAVDILANDGVDYAVRHYTSGNSFKDPKTAALWDEASNALEALIDYLKAETGRDLDNE